MARRPALVALLACLLPLALLAVEQRSLAGYVSGDFLIFRKAVARFLADPATLYGTPEQAQWYAAVLQGYIYPPPGIFALLPFGALPQGAGFALFATLLAMAAVGMAWLSLHLARQHLGASLPRPEALFLALMAMASGPVFACRGGQVDLLVLCLALGAVACALGQRAGLAGVQIALGAWFKIYPVLLLPPLLLATPQWRRLLAGFAAAAVAVPLASLPFLPLPVWHTYFGTMLPQLSARAIVNIYNQSLSAVWLRAQLPGPAVAYTFDALPVPAMVRATVLALGAASVGWFALAIRRGAPPLLASLAVLATISPLAPLGWGHAYVYVLPLWLALAARARTLRDMPAALLLGALWLLLLASAHRQFALAEAHWMIAQLLYARYALAATLLLAMAAHACRKPGLGGVILPPSAAPQ
ncbi:MAG: DUF2029 domain-containing protein [Proteobacteria bacterium]|nr:DUF2029 domain-containing protein [Pseudomonadota bacterium]